MSTLVTDRERMLALLRRHIRDERILEAFRDVPREEFVLPEYRDAAYEDRALSIGEGQTISQPLMVALELAAGQILASDRVLEVGTGSGYQAALLAKLASKVITVERIPALRERAAQILATLGAKNVTVAPAADTLGWPASAPYDVILVAAAGPHIPRSLLDQLSDDGRLVMPVGARNSQELVRARRSVHGITLERLGPCAFVPLVGRDAWQDGGQVASSNPTSSNSIVV